MKHKLFVFGTCGKGLAHHGLLRRFEAEFLTEAVYPHRSKQVNLGHVPGLVPASASEAVKPITGAVFLVSEGALVAYDRHHGVPALMVRHKVKVYSDAEAIRAWVHHLARPESWANRPTTDGSWGGFVDPDTSWRRPPKDSSYADWWDDYMARKEKEVADKQEVDEAYRPWVAKVAPEKPVEVANTGFTTVVREAMENLSEGAELTVTTKFGSRVHYTRKNGILRVTKYEAPGKPTVDFREKESALRLVPDPEPTPPVADVPPAEDDDDDQKDPDESTCVACGDPIFWTTGYGWLDSSVSPECAWGETHTPGVYDTRRTEQCYREEGCN